VLESESEDSEPVKKKPTKKQRRVDMSNLEGEVEVVKDEPPEKQIEEEDTGGGDGGQLEDVDDEEVSKVINAYPQRLTRS